MGSLKRFAFALPAPLLCLIGGAALASLPLETSRPVTLSDSQRAAVEKVACAKSPNKTAIGAQGYRGAMPGHHELTAIVQCDDGIELDAYHAYFERYCTKRGFRWSCEEPQIRLHMEVAGGGPYQIRLNHVSLDDALRGMSCLTTALSQNPQVLKGGKADRIPVVSAFASKSERLGAYLEAHNECYWIEYPRQCSPDGGEPLPVSIDSGCMDE